MEPSWVEHLYKNDINHHYDERCQIFLDMDITDETFKDHALFLLKESLKTFSPYSEKAKELLNAGGLYDNTETYQTALQEIRNGQKRTHWIWYVFPQMKGLGHSEISQFYGIDGREEAYEYIANPILRERLIEATKAILDSDKTVYEIFGQDTIKVRSCMLLFASVSDIPEIKQLINRYNWK